MLSNQFIRLNVFIKLYAGARAMLDKVISENSSVHIKGGGSSKC